jgi:hypothetical protein
MPIKITCTCGRQLMVPESRAGRAVNCPKCGARVEVPGGEETRSVEREVRSVVGESARGAEPKVEVTQKVEKQAEAIPPEGPAPTIVELVAAPPPIIQAEPAPPPAPSIAPVAPPLPNIAPPPVAAPVAPPKPSLESPVPLALPGYRPDADKLTAAYVLSMLLVCLGIFSMVPGVLDVVRYLGDPDSEAGFVGRWAFVVFFLGCIHLAYALYIGQLPDWSTSWILTGATLLQAALYAAVLTALYLAGGQSELVEALDLGAHVDNGRARAWCFVMLCATGLVAYFCGRVSIRWRRAFVLVRDAYRR